MNTKKLQALFCTLFIAISFIACKKSETILQDGIFVGAGEGKDGPITVSITITGGKVTDAEIISDSENPEISDVAKRRIMQLFKTSGSTKNIDAISGATLTSRGLIEALDAALISASGKKSKKQVYTDTKCDIAIIGAGGAGLIAATEAASKGAHVIVLEKMGIVGGNSNFSTGGINAAYTKEQERLGITDDKETFYDDTMKGGYYMNDPALVHTLVNNSKDIVEWLQSPIIGADLSDVGIFGGATNKRIHRPKGGAAIGAHLIPLLHKAALAQGAEIRLNNKVIDILKEENKAIGVRVVTAEGEYIILAKAIIIATGGFGANAEMVAMYQPALARFGTTNHRGATGDAFAMVEKFDAELSNMTQIQTHSTVVPGSNIMITEAVRGNGAILVNVAGNRFVNEMETRDVVSAEILKQKDKCAFLVFDQNVRESLKAIDDYYRQGLLTQGNTLAELAEKIHVPISGLTKTLETYNKFVLNGVDSDFHRNAGSMDCVLNKAPFYAVKCIPAIHYTMGGLKINTKAQVMNKNQKAIPGLYAAGEVTGGVHGGARLGGNAVADYCVFGKIAADSALQYIGM